MTDLQFTGSGTMVYAAIDRQSTADPAAQGDVSNDAVLATSAVDRFAQAGDVRVVIGEGGEPCAAADPFDDGEVVPTFHMMAARNLALAPAHRTAKANS